MLEITLNKRGQRTINEVQFQERFLPITQNLNSNYDIKICMKNGEEYSGRVIGILEEEKTVYTPYTVPLDILFKTETTNVHIDTVQIQSVEDVD